MSSILYRVPAARQSYPQTLILIWQPCHQLVVSPWIRRLTCILLFGGLLTFYLIVIEGQIIVSKMTSMFFMGITRLLSAAHEVVKPRNPALKSTKVRMMMSALDAGRTSLDLLRDCIDQKGK